jgi:hypothetical protein
MKRASLPCACAAALLLAGSCAAPLKIATSVDPLALLEDGSLAYARLSGRAARELAPYLFPAAELASLKPLLARTRIIALGMGSSPAAGGAGVPLAPRPAFQAALIGDYPFRTASLSFGASPDWKREKSAYYNAKLGLRAAVPGPSLLLASSGPIEGLLAAAKAPGPSPVPEELSGTASRELLLWAPEPFAGIAAAMLGEAMEVPARGLLIAASPLPGDEGSYETTIVFVMDDAKALRIYKSALKLAWYGMARALFGDEAESALALPFTAEGRLFMVSGLPLSRESLGRVVAALGSGFGSGPRVFAR